MIFKTIFGQDQAINFLKHDIKSTNISHAYLFSGPLGVGKTKTALQFAKAIACPEGGCLSCIVCKSFERNLHPDFLHIQPQGKFISIAQVRDLGHWAAFKPAQGRRKIAIISEVERFTEEAANALLKTLEEPQENVVFICTTSNNNAVLSTIISRCRQVKFEPIPFNILVNHLVDNGAGLKKAQLAARISQGIFGKALDLVKNDELWDLRETSLNFLTKAVNLQAFEISFEVQSLFSTIKTFQDKLFKESELKVFDVVTLKQAQKKSKKLKTAKSQEVMCQVLDFWWLWLRDVVVCKETGNKESLVNIDRFDEIKNHCQNSEGRNIWFLLERIPKVKQMILQNINSHLAIVEMFLKATEKIAL